MPLFNQTQRPTQPCGAGGSPAAGRRRWGSPQPGPPHALLSSSQLGANALLFVGVNMYGVFVRVLAERSQRRAFLQARSCIEDRLRLEDENEKQASA